MFMNCRGGIIAILILILISKTKREGKVIITLDTLRTSSNSLDSF